MLTIYLVRHGETVENKQHVLQGHLPGQLSDEGIRQLERLRKLLSGETFDVIVTSDLKRAYDSAVILNEAFHAPLLYSRLLRERDWGSLTGIQYSAAQKTEIFPPDVETQEQGMLRATEFLSDMFERFNGKKILAVGHGFINRCIMSVAYSLPRQDVPRFDNAEFRVLHISHEIDYIPEAREHDEVSND